MSSKRVFISHAFNDKPLVDAFFDFLQTGIGLSPNDTFCSSLEGLGIPAGEEFTRYIKDEMQEPDVVLVLLSRQYLDSFFCICEMGAGWAMSHKVVPVLIPPITFSDMQAPLAGIHAYRINVDTDLSSLRDLLNDTVPVENVPTARWDAKRSLFLQGLPALLENQKAPTQVSFSQFEKVTITAKEAAVEIERAYKENAEMRKQIEALKGCKDRADVVAVEATFCGEMDRFQVLCTKAHDTAFPLPAPVLESVFHIVTKTGSTPGRAHLGQLERVEQDGYIEIRDGEIKLCEGDPKVKRYLDAIGEVRDFLDTEKSPPSYEFWEQFEAKHDYEPKFSSRRLWEDLLGLKSYTRW